VIPGLAAESPRIGRLEAFPSGPPAPSRPPSAPRPPHDDGPLARYLRARHSSRHFIDAWRPAFGLLPVAWTGVVPAEDYDVLCWFPRAVATTP
jgi:hypothetical protein